MWIREADFLLDADVELTTLGGGVDFVVGNPPYLRLESIEPNVAKKYRKLYETMTHRADLYVGFFEKGLKMLAPDGACAFICADRWMLNQYGSRLRELVTLGGFAVETIVEMYGAAAFRSEVLAYPAITIIRRSERQGKVLVAEVNGTSGAAVDQLVEVNRRVRRSPENEGEGEEERPIGAEVKYAMVDEWFEGSAPWPRVSPTALKLLRRLEAEFPPLEDAVTGTRVGIGVATGADKVFLTKDADSVEAERLLPLAMAKDTITGTLEWSGTYLVNPWESDGTIVDLDRYPRLRRYFEEHEETIKGRNVAKRSASRWWRTIDKVNHDLVAQPKLLIPDIKSFAHPTYDEGEFYPHHNLYHVTSDEWDMKVLGGILISRVAQFFIECYAVRMNGGYLRFQAQYLRRIRVPRPEDITQSQAERLRRAFDQRDADAATAIALNLYGLTALP